MKKFKTQHIIITVMLLTILSIPLLILYLIFSYNMIADVIQGYSKRSLSPIFILSLSGNSKEFTYKNTFSGDWDTAYLVDALYSGGQDLQSRYTVVPPVDKWPHYEVGRFMLYKDGKLVNTTSFNRGSFYPDSDVLKFTKDTVFVTKKINGTTFVDAKNITDKTVLSIDELLDEQQLSQLLKGDFITFGEILSILDWDTGYFVDEILSKKHLQEKYKVKLGSRRGNALILYNNNEYMHEVYLKDLPLSKSVETFTKDTKLQIVKDKSGKVIELKLAE